jgi:uncharacterized protein with GYD domain
MIKAARTDQGSQQGDRELGRKVVAQYACLALDFVNVLEADSEAVVRISVESLAPAAR